MEIIRRLKKVDANFISLVGKGANNKIILFKSGKKTDGLEYQKLVDFKKVDGEQRIVYGIVYSPDEVDLQGDLASADVIKDMAYSFMKNARTNNVDQQHNFIGDEGFVAESWLTKFKDPVFPLEKEGSWAVGIKIEKEDTWQLVKSGEITGLSIAGFAVVEEVKNNEASNNEPDKFFEKLKKYFSFKKEFNSFINQEAVNGYFTMLEKNVEEILASDSNMDKRTAIIKCFRNYLEALIKAEVLKSGRSISTKNLEKLKLVLNELKSTIDQTCSGNIEIGNEDNDQNNIHKNNNAGYAGQNGEVEMTDAELRKTIEESTKFISEKLELLEKTNTDLALRLDAIEKATPGSRQVVKKDKVNANQIPIWT